MTSADQNSAPDSGRAAAPPSWIGPRTFTTTPTGNVAETPPWPTSRPQHGPVNAPLRAAEYPTVTDPQGSPVDHTLANEPAASQASLDELHDKVSGLQDSMSARPSSGTAAQGGQQGSGQYQQSGTKQTPFATPVSALQQQAQKHQAQLESMVASHANLAQTRAGVASQFARRQAQGSRVTPSGSGNAASDAFNDQSMAGALTGSGLFSASGNGSSAATWSRKRFLP